MKITGFLVIKKFLFIFFIILSFSPRALAGEKKINSQIPSTEKLNLDNCLNVALANNPNFLSYYENLESLKRKETKTLQTMFPKVSISETDTNYIGDNYDAYEAGVNVTQTLYQGKTLITQHKLAKIARERAEFEVIRQAQLLTLNVKKAWFQILEAQDLLNETKESLERLRQHVAHAQYFYKEGRIWYNDVLQAQVKEANGKQNLIKAKNKLTLAKSKMNVLLHRNIDSPIGINDKLQYTPGHWTTFEEVRDVALKNRADLAQSFLDLEKSKANVIISKADLWPTLNTTFNITRYNDSLDWKGGSEEATAVISASWEIWNWGTTKNEIKSSKAKVRESNFKLKKILDEIVLEVQEAWLSLREAKEKVHLLEDSLEKGQENYRVNQIRYQEQLGTASDVLDAQDLLTTTQKDYISSMTDYLTSLATLNYVTGYLNDE